MITLILQWARNAICVACSEHRACSGGLLHGQPGLHCSREHDARLAGEKNGLRWISPPSSTQKLIGYPVGSVVGAPKAECSSQAPPLKSVDFLAVRTLQRIQECLRLHQYRAEAALVYPGVLNKLCRIDQVAANRGRTVAEICSDLTRHEAVCCATGPSSRKHTTR